MGGKMDITNQYPWPGWFLVGQYDSEVGCWLLYSGNEAMLLEVPEGLRVGDVLSAAKRLGVRIYYVTTSHDHPDHYDMEVWEELQKELPDAEFLHPVCRRLRTDRCRKLEGEPVYLVGAPKHSQTDMVVIFRGVAMTGDIELGTFGSVTHEVSLIQRRKSMEWLRDFPQRQNYYVHTVVSAHLDDIREGVNWEQLFYCKEVESARSKQ